MYEVLKYNIWGMKSLNYSLCEWITDFCNHVFSFI